MDLVDEKHVAFFQTGEQAGQFTGFFNDRSTRVFDAHAHRVRDDVGQGGFAKAGRAAQQNVLEDVVPFFGRFHHQFQTLAHFHLAGEFAEHRRPQRNFESGIWFRWFHFDVDLVDSVAEAVCFPNKSGGTLTASPPVFCASIMHVAIRGFW